MRYNFLEQRLKRNQFRGLHRSLNFKEKIDFISNDYLGLTRDPIFQQRLKNRILSYREPISGSRSSRLLGGHHRLIDQTERELAIFSKTESALFYPSGYQANVGLISALVGKNDLILSDELNHASIIDGIKLAKGQKEIFKHNDLEDLEGKLYKNTDKFENVFVICESLYSMEGTISPLKEIAKLSKKFNANLIIDESHSTGLYAQDGSGLVNELGIRDDVLCTIHTAGKALGVSGAWIAGGQVLKDYLVNFSRGFIFSTAPAPTQFLALSESLSYVINLEERRNDLRLKSKKVRRALQNSAVEVLGDDSPVIPIVIGDSEKTINFIQQFDKEGINVAGIRFPTVSENKARLRISLGSHQTDQDIDKLLEVINGIIHNGN